MYLAVALAGCSQAPTEVARIDSTSSALTADQCEFFAEDGKVTICHRTSSAKNPYTINRIDVAGCHGHSTHAGDYVAYNDPTCDGQGCFPEGAPFDGTVECCEGLAPVYGHCQVEGRCSGDFLRIDQGDPLQCCQRGNEIWQTLNGRRAALRVIGTPCTEADGVGKQCGQDCVYGPCGTKRPVTKDGSVVKIFYPRSDPSVCGVDLDGTKLSGPEKYDDQTLYAGAIATCPYTSCAWPGIPVP